MDEAFLGSQRAPWYCVHTDQTLQYHSEPVGQYLYLVSRRPQITK